MRWNFSWEDNNHNKAEKGPRFRQHFRPLNMHSSQLVSRFLPGARSNSVALAVLSYLFCEAGGRQGGGRRHSDLTYRQVYLAKPVRSRGVVKNSSTKCTGVLCIALVCSLEIMVGFVPF